MPPQGANNEELAKTKSAYEAFLGEPGNLKAVREALKVRPILHAMFCALWKIGICICFGQTQCIKVNKGWV